MKTHCKTQMKEIVKKYEVPAASGDKVGMAMEKAEDVAID